MKLNPILQKVVDVILGTVPSVKIVLLAYINIRKEVFSIFENTCIEVKDPAELNIFIIARISNSDRHAAVDTIEQRCCSIIPLTILIMSTEEFASLVNRRSPFATVIQQSKHVLYPIRMKSQWEKEDSHELTEVNNIITELTCWYKRGMAFWEIAGAQFRFGEYGMAAFCIHQAAEQFLSMLLQAITGYRVGTHNLDRLLRLLRFYIPDVGNVFNRETTLEKEQFLLLKSTYIHFRYRSDFKISEKDVHYFLGELAKLQGIAERVFQTHASTRPSNLSEGI